MAEANSGVNSNLLSDELVLDELSERRPQRHPGRDCSSLRPPGAKGLYGSSLALERRPVPAPIRLVACSPRRASPLITSAVTRSKLAGRSSRTVPCHHRRDTGSHGHGTGFGRPDPADDRDRRVKRLAAPSPSGSRRTPVSTAKSSVGGVVQLSFVVFDPSLPLRFMSGRPRRREDQWQDLHSAVAAAKSPNS